MCGIRRKGRGKKEKCFLSDSNQRPIDLQSSALPSELRKLTSMVGVSGKRCVKGECVKKKSYREEKGKKWFHPDLNRGPSLRQSDVITNYTMKPLRGMRKIRSQSKQGECDQGIRGVIRRGTKMGEKNAPRGARTHDRAVKSRTLYRLS